MFEGFFSQVAINNTTDLAVFQDRVPAAQLGISTLWESPLVPNDVLMVRSDMPIAMREKLAQEFFSYGRNAEEKALLKQASGIEKFVPTDNGILEPVSGFKFSTERAQIEQDKTLFQGQRDLRLSEISQRQQRFLQALERKK